MELVNQRNNILMQAIACYKMALAIDDQPAILNWRIGTAEFLLGNRVLGRVYLRRSIDQDGYFLRSISALHEKSRAVAQRYQNVVFVDPIIAFHSVEDLGVNANDNFLLICIIRVHWAIRFWPKYLCVC